MEEVKAILLIKGRVQGVFFRAYTRDLALKLGLKGYVRNLPLRRVEVIFVGLRKQVDKAIAWCHQGPPLANVREVIVSWDEPDQQFKTFEIRY